MHFWKHCKKSSALWEGSGPRPHLNPLPRGEEDAKRQVRVEFNATKKTVLITFWISVPAKTEPRVFFDFLQQQGYLRIWIDNKIARVR
jgi:hypothetical protein